MHKKILILIVGWTALITSILFINLCVLNDSSENLIRVKANAIFKLLVTTRLWNANHGLVYVPVNHKMQPNPYLIHSRRDAITNHGDSLTLINPAFMTRQISELSEATGSTSFHITSLNPIRPANKPDEWEIKALKTFANASDEYYEKVKVGDSTVFRYMAPLVTSQSCLACHASQGYRLGDIRGGISVNIPYDRNNCISASTNKIIVVYAIIYLAGLLLIMYFRAQSKRYIREIETLNGRLRDMTITKDKFFSLVAHDLKTPAANIMSLTVLLKNSFLGVESEEQKGYIDMLHDSAITHNSLLNNLLDLSRAQMGSLQYKPEKLNIHSLVDDVLEQTQLQARQKHIIQINKADESFAKADSNMVATVLRNLIVNAIKFTHPGGSITISAQIVNGEILVSVADTGIGIRKEVINGIFGVDYHKSTIGTAKEPGTGLGLMICKEFVERNKGKIWVESKVDAGSTFFFTLPVFQ